MYKFLGSSHLENLRGQKLQNLEQFHTTFEFDRECLGNQLRYRKSGTNLIEVHPWGFSKKICELWSTNKKVIGVDVDLP